MMNMGDSYNSSIVIEGIDHTHAQHTPSSLCLYPRHPQKYFSITSSTSNNANTNNNSASNSNGNNKKQANATNSINGKANNNSKQSNNTNPQQFADIPQLLDVWPSYLERLLPTSPNRFVNTAFGVDALLSNTNAHLLNTSQSPSPTQLANMHSSSSSSSSSGNGVYPHARMHRVYEGASAGGRGIPSRCPPVLPYDVPNEGN
jgi:hypothetical protein